MTRVITFVVITAIGFIFSSTATAQNVQNFEIKNFTAYYNLTINDSGESELKTDEFIQAVFPDFDQNHGILRALPSEYGGVSTNLKIIGIDMRESPMHPTNTIWKFSTYEQNNNLVLRVGDANIFVHGVQNYHISYAQSNVIRAYGTHDEFFWNVNGTQWQQSIKNVSAEMIIPTNLASSLRPEQKCFTGPAGSKQQDCTVARSSNQDGSVKITVTANRELSAGENLSFAIMFEPNTFVVHGPTFFERIEPFLPILIGLAIPLIMIFIVFRSWRKSGRDPKSKHTVIAQYQAPKEASLLVNDFCLNESLRTKAISAQIINFAVRGFVRIIDTQKDKLIGKKHEFSIELINDISKLTVAEQKIISMLFDNPIVGTTVDLSTIKSKASEINSLSKQVANEAVTADLFKADPSKIVQSFAAKSALLFIPGFIGVISGNKYFICLGVGCIIGAIIGLIAAKIMPARTEKGVELRNYLLGLKLYIEMAEEDRIKFHQSPETATRKRINSQDNKTMVHIFEELLPYAMLFNMEKKWVKQFENLYKTTPDWYQGSSGSFARDYFVGSLASFSSTATTSFSPPSSSSSSGFSGGGSSGGGGGGGGGGGW